ncbi:MAG: hypothetical protein JXQ73_00965 [Phycisphaerae bacterium]|nr:hypothetical protein [Phycisphaerae bacterium]
MAMIDINWTPTRRDLRVFGVIMLIGCGIVGAVLRSYDLAAAGKIVWAVGAGIGVLGLAAPPLVKPVYLLLTVVSWPIGYVVSHVVLAVFYYVIITGTGLIFRLVGRDPLQRKFEPGAPSYWQPKTLPDAGNRERYFRQF